MKQIVINLLSNAIKFTAKGGITLKAKAKQGAAQIAVKDTGIGIRSEDMSKLFSEFCTIREHQAINPNGTGLGLYLCKKFASLMNGSITVKSTYGKGTKFTLRLPLAEDCTLLLEESKDAIKKAVTYESKCNEGVDNTSYSESRSKTILVVDDDSINLFVVSRLIRKHLINSDKALDGKQAIDLVKRRGFDNPYSLILMDMNMPVMSGPEVRTSDG